MKKYLGILLAMVMAAAVLTGCGRDGNGELHRATTGNYNGSLKKNQADLVVTFEKGGYGDEWIVSLKNAFQTATGKTVFIEGEKGISDYVANRIETGQNCSDVFFVDNGSFPVSEIAQGWLEDLTGLYMAEVENGNTVSGLLWDSFADYGKVDEKYYYLPWTVGVGSFYYNMDILESAGWGTPPKTYAEMLQLVNDINNLAVNKDGNANNDIAPFAWSGKLPSYWQFVVDTWFVQLVGLDNYREYQKLENVNFFDTNYIWTNPDTGKTVNFALAKQKALSMLEGLVVNVSTKQVINTIPNYATKDYVFVQAEFAEGKAAMIPNGSWLERELADAGIDDSALGNISVMSVPFATDARKDTEGNYIAVNNTLSYNYCMIPQKAAHKETAKEFLLFSLKESNLKSFTYDSFGFRPFNYTINKASLTFCAQNIYNIAVEAESVRNNFSFLSKGALARNGKAAMWYGNPFASMCTGTVDNRKNSAEYIAEEKTTVGQIFDLYLND